MRIVWASTLLLAGVGAGLLLGGGAVSRAQPAPASQPQQRSFFSMQARGSPKSLNDTVRGALLEYDPPKGWDLLIIGGKGKGQYTCELRSADKQTLFAIQRTITEQTEVTVNCANGMPSSRGGVMIDLDDPKGGSFVLGTQRSF